MVCDHLHFLSVRSGMSYHAFVLLQIGDALDAIFQLPDKCSAVSQIPMYVLKHVAGLIAPSTVELFNRSLETDCFLTRFEETFSTPILKKAGLD